MTYLVDSDWVAEYLKGRQRAVQVLSALSEQGLAISLITFGEIYEGIYYGQNRASHEAGFRQFLRSVEVIPLNRRVMRRFALIRGDLRRRGELTPDPDILIAATAVHYDLTLLTHNVKDFRRIPGLKLYESA